MTLRKGYSTFGGIFDRAPLEDELKSLDHEMQRPDFWEDPQASAPLVRKRKSIERRLGAIDQLESDAEDLGAWRELAGEGETGAELDSFLKAVGARVEKLELEFKLSGPDDERDAIFEIHPGAGGTDSQDWAEMLLRMYLRWAERSGFEVELLERQDGEEAGIKSATCAVRGEYAYGYLKGESGVHRLVRISPFDAAARRHTAFASMHTYPDIDDEIEIDLDEKDLRIDTYRSSGAGGQHVNVTDSAVRITHNPTGIVVSCQNERSQHKNKATAMKVLRARLYQLELEKRAEEQAQREGEKMEIGWGSQIRSYTLHPSQRVKDHRTNFEVGDANRVLDGDVDPFIEEWLKTQMNGPAERGP